MRSELALLAALGLAAIGRSDARAEARKDPRAAGPAAADPLAVLREAGRTWTYEVAQGDSLDKLEQTPNAPRVRCKVVAWTVPGPLAGSILECEEVTAPGAPAGRAWKRHLVFDAVGVRELDDEGDLADRSKTRGLTLPRKLAGTWQLDEKGADDRRTRVTVREEAAPARGASPKRWTAETTRWPPARASSSAPELEVVQFLPGTGPVMLCTRTASPSSYHCLRLTEDKPPSGRITISSKQAHDQSTLKASDVAAKIASAYAPALRQCYRSLLAKRATARGALTLAFTVNAVGKTEDVSAKGFDATLAACAAKHLETWRFPIPQSRYAEPRTARFTIGLDLAP